MGRKTKAEKPTKTISKKSRKKKDPDQPKRPLTAYFLFCAAHRDEIKEKNPSAKFGEIGKLLSEQWKSASKAEKDKYEKQANEEKEKYKKLKAEYDRKAKEKSSAKDEDEEEEEEEEGSGSDASD